MKVTLLDVFPFVGIPFKNESTIKLKHVFKDIYTLKTPRGPCKVQLFYLLKDKQWVEHRGYSTMFPFL